MRPQINYRLGYMVSRLPPLYRYIIFKIKIGDTMINDEEFYIRDDGTKCVVFFCDLDIVVLTERDIKWFQKEFDKLDKETE